MRILFVGDVVGLAGCRAVVELVPALRAELSLDAVVVNCENAASGGRGISPLWVRHLLAAGVDVLTGGNHIWHLPELAPVLDAEPRLVRPANYPDARPGRGSTRVRLADGRSLGVVQVEGRVFMRKLDCPFAAAEAARAALGPCDATLLDVHAEASSEKQALAWHLDGRYSAVVGTHTHVPTADARVLPQGTAYMTDAGMTGPYRSVIGMAPEVAIQRFIGPDFKASHAVGEGEVRLCGAVIDVDPATGRAVAIRGLQRPFLGK